MTILEKEYYHNNTEWIYRTLKDNGNCYVNEIPNLKEIEETTGLKLRIKPAYCGGYIIEVIKK